MKTPTLVRELRIDDTTVRRDYESRIEFHPTTASQPYLAAWLTPQCESAPTKPPPPIQFKLIRVAPVQVVPSTIFLEFDGMKSELSRNLVVMANDSTKCKILSAASSLPWVTVTIADPKACQLVVSAKSPEMIPAFQEAHIEIETDHPRCPTIRVPMTIVFRGNAAK